MLYLSALDIQMHGNKCSLTKNNWALKIKICHFNHEYEYETQYMVYEKLINILRLV